MADERIKKTYSDGDFLQAVSDHDLADTSTIAEAVGCAARTAQRRLAALENDEELISKQIGRSKIWIREDG